MSVITVVFFTLWVATVLRVRVSLSTAFINVASFECVKLSQLSFSQEESRRFLKFP